MPATRPCSATAPSPNSAALRLYVKTRATVPDGADTAKAIDYTLNRWPALIRYAETGHLPIDNNPVENAIRPIAIGKKNWLFAGSERAAVIQSLLGTAKLNGLGPRRLAQGHPGKAPHLAQQPHRRTAAVEVGSENGLKGKKATPW